MLKGVSATSIEAITLAITPVQVDHQLI